jgi:uncharacterized protein (DUF952 family)
MRSENPNPEFIYKVAPRPLWQAAATKGHLAGAPIDLADGFIHFSTADQLAETLGKHFAGEGDLILVAVRTRALGKALKWEVSRGGALFPHLYGPLDTATVEWTAPISVAADGSCELPEAVR